MVTRRSFQTTLTEDELQTAIKRIKKVVAKSGAMDVRIRKSNVSNSYYLTGMKKYPKGRTYTFLIRISDHHSGEVKRVKDYDWHGQCSLEQFESHLKRSLAAGWALRD